MSEQAEAHVAEQQNGKPPAAPPVPQATGLPEGTITVGPQTHATIVRLIQGHQGISDVLRAYLDAKEVREPYALVVPVVLLVPQKEG